MRASSSGALEREINQRQVNPIFSATDLRCFPSKNRVIRHHTREKCRPAEREQHLMFGTGEISIPEGAFMLQPRALYEFQLCDSMLAAEYPSSNRNQRHSRSSMAPQKCSGLVILQRIYPPWGYVYVRTQIKETAGSAPICQSPRSE